MGNAGLDEAQAGIKISGRNINNLTYADDITLSTSGTATTDGTVALVNGYTFNKLHTAVNSGGTAYTVADFVFGVPKSLQMVIAAMKLKDAYSLEGKL